MSAIRKKKLWQLSSSLVKKNMASNAVVGSDRGKSTPRACPTVGLGVYFPLVERQTRPNWFLVNMERSGVFALIIFVCIGLELCKGCGNYE